MSRSQTPIPHAPALVAAAAAATLAGAVLLALPLPGPPPDHNDLVGWWESSGTATATASILRLVALVLVGWTLLAVVIGLVAATTRAAPAVLAWRLAAPPMLRRGLLATAIVSTTALPTTAGAADSGEPVAIVQELGPAQLLANAPLPMLFDLGTAAEEEADEPTSPPTTAQSATETWTVQRGDHLWHIAEQTLHERGEAATVDAITTYWQRVIETNRDIVGTNPDLILPGAVLTLP